MLVRKILIFFFSVIAAALLLFVISLKCNYTPAIIMYHSVNTTGSLNNRLVVSPATFERQMRFLKERRYNVLPLSELAGLIRDKKKIPPKAVAITFDDGYKDNYTFAFPILKKYSLPATISLIIDEIGRPDRLNWQEISQMSHSRLIEFASHCLGPEPLVNLKSDSQVEMQIYQSKKILEEKLGVKVLTLSYPEGKFNERIKQLARGAGYSFALATNPGKNYANDDVFALKRLRISENAANLFVFWAETSGYYNFIRENRHK
ncbi:MAG: polysaccharide deacetylase family protein [Candidatus Omnitrophota bacterium]